MLTFNIACTTSNDCGSAMTCNGGQCSCAIGWYPATGLRTPTVTFCDKGAAAATQFKACEYGSSGTPCKSHNHDITFLCNLSAFDSYNWYLSSNMHSRKSRLQSNWYRLLLHMPIWIRVRLIDRKMHPKLVSFNQLNIMTILLTITSLSSTQ